jgi:hypothetical protein
MGLAGLKGFIMVREVAQKVYDAVMLDYAGMLSYACMLDFSLEGGKKEFTDRFGALQIAARSGATPSDFDSALGSGQKLTALVAKYGSNVVFPKTVWDKMEEEEEEESILSASPEAIEYKKVMDRHHTE